MVGTGFFKPNVSTMVGQLYRENDPRRDGGFTIFYMGVNVGALVGPLVCGDLAESPRCGWHYGFGAAGVGMVLRPRACTSCSRHATYRGSACRPSARPPSSARPPAPRAPLTRVERDCLIALLVMMAFSIPFWTAFEQTGSSMNFFAAERTRRIVLGHAFPATWFQSVNPRDPAARPRRSSPGCGPRSRARGLEPSTPVKMGVGACSLDGGSASSSWSAARAPATAARS